MNVETKKDWRDVVHALLQAFRDDVRRHLESWLSDSEAQVLKEQGTQSVKQGHDKAIMACCDGLGQPPPKESYVAVEESSS